MLQVLQIMLNNQAIMLCS